jgi:hypothetical protein
MPDARLEVHDSLGRRPVPIDKAVFTIGRRSGNDLHLMGSDVSRDHAEIAQVEGRFLSSGAPAARNWCSFSTTRQLSGSLRPRWAICVRLRRCSKGCVLSGRGACSTKCWRW